MHFARSIPAFRVTALSMVLLACQGAHSFSLKDAIRKSVAEAKASAPQAGGEAGADTDAPQLAQGYDNLKAPGPLSLETLGVKLGDTPEQADEALRKQGLTFLSQSNHMLGPELSGRLWARNYALRDPKDVNREYISMRLRFGPQSGRLLGIWRQDNFPAPVSAEKLESALIAKYGQPNGPKKPWGLNPYHWVAYQPGYAAAKGHQEICDARSSINVNGEVAESRLKDCRYAVWVVLSGADAGEPLFRHMELMIADHSTVVAEFKAMRALAEQKKQERYEQQKKAALPSL